jgi:hypothetical protein
MPIGSMSVQNVVFLGLNLKKLIFELTCDLNQVLFHFLSLHTPKSRLLIHHKLGNAFTNFEKVVAAPNEIFHLRKHVIAFLLEFLPVN